MFTNNLFHVSYAVQIQTNQSTIQQTMNGPIPVAVRAKVWVCGRSLPGIAGSNPAWGRAVCLL